MTLTLSDEGLERTSGKFTEKVSYQDISRLDINQRPSGQIVHIKLATTARKIFSLSGFENMELLIQQLEDHVPDKSRVHRKRQALDWSNLLFSIVIGLVIVIVLLWIQGLGRYANSIFSASSSLALGVYFLAFRPISRSGGKRFEKFETIMGIALLIIGAANIVLLSAGVGA